jgi:cephalosporin hydroxylase
MIKQMLEIVSNSISFQKNKPHVKTHFGDLDPSQYEYYILPKDTNARLSEFIQRVLLGVAAEYAVKKSNGNILEIGCAEGWTTVTFAQIARKYGKKVYCIDPYNGQQEGSPVVHNQFKKTLEEYKDVIIHLQISSLSEEVLSLIGNEKMSFSFVDGLHTHAAAYSDILLSLKLMNIGDIICVDDTNNFSYLDAGAAFIDAINNNLIEKIDINPSSEIELFTQKSWHFGIKK